MTRKQVRGLVRRSLEDTERRYKVRCQRRGGRCVVSIARRKQPGRKIIASAETWERALRQALVPA